MGEITLAVSDAGDGLRARLDEEINSGVAAIRWPSARIPSRHPASTPASVTRNAGARPPTRVDTTRSTW